MNSPVVFIFLLTHPIAPSRLEYTYNCVIETENKVYLAIAQLSTKF
jgi:hypothetical protein